MPIRFFALAALITLHTYQAHSIREHMLDFPETELEHLELPGYFEENERMSVRDARMSPRQDAAQRDDVRNAREYILRSGDLKTVLGSEFNAAQARKERMRSTLDALYQNAGKKVASKISKPEDRQSIERQNERDRSATITLTEMIADYMEYNQKKRVAFKSTCLEDLGVPGAQDPRHQVDINYMVYDFDRYPRLAELKYFGAPSGKGPVLLLPGRAEPSYKWVEFAHELYRRGYGPIMSIDHRGQGLSSRVPWIVKQDDDRFSGLVPTRFATAAKDVHEVGHVDLFRCYIDDVNTFMSKIAQPLLDSWHSKYPSQRHYKVEDIMIIGHSTGGAIAQGYLMRSASDAKSGSSSVIPQNVFLISPMFGLSVINAAKGFVGKILNRQGGKPKPALDWSRAWKAISSTASSAINFADCKLNATCLDIASRAGITTNLVHDPLNLTTHSAARYLHYRILVNLWPEGKIAAISTNWLQEAGLFFGILHDDSNVYEKTGLRIYVGGDATGLEGERVVDNREIVRYCREKQSNFKECSVIPLGNLPQWGLAGARHAIHTEDDWYREQVLRDIDSSTGGPFLLHDMIVRCEEDHKASWHNGREDSKGIRLKLTDPNEKKDLQNRLAENCVSRSCRKPTPPNASKEEKNRIDAENSACLTADLMDRNSSWGYHRIPQLFMQKLK